MQTHFLHSSKTFINPQKGCFMKRLIVFAMIFMLTAVNIVSMISERSGSEEIMHVYDASGPIVERTITIQNSGTKYNLGNVSIRNGVNVYDAYFNLTGMADGVGDYPTMVNLDVGDDNDFQYRFNGQGYGSMGLQTRFADNHTTGMYTFGAGGSSNALEILLPKSANVLSAEMKLNGRLNQIVDTTRIDTDQSNVQEVHPADLDGDNDTDVVAVGNGEVVWYNNTNGKGVFGSEHKINSSQSNAAAVFVGDVDFDGDMDVVAASRGGGGSPYGPVVYYRNLDGTGRNWSVVTVNASNEPLYNCYNIAIADMDNDGDGDIVATSRNSSAPTGPWWFNNTDGNGTSWTTHSIANNFVRNMGLEIFDVDGDGDNDTVVTNWWSQQVAWFENINNASSWSNAITMANPSLWSTYNLAKGDIDGDGDIDVAVAGRQGISWLRHPSDPKTTWTTTRIYTETGMWWNGDVTVGDFGNPGMEPDGNLDVALVTYTNVHDVIWCRNNGNPIQANWEFYMVNRNHNSAYSIKAAEIDGTGSIDLVAGANTGSGSDDVVWYKLNGSFASNVRLDLGDDTTTEWSYTSGWFNTSATVAGLAAPLNSILAAAPAPTPDAYGNQMVPIKLKLTTDTGGLVAFYEVDIEYDYTAKVTGTPAKSLAAELYEHIGTGSTGNSSIPIVVECNLAGGKLKIDGIYIEYNDYPKALATNVYSLDEDTKNATLVDLSKYFTDDYFDSTDLTYEWVSNTNSSNIIVEISNDYFLSVDAETGTENDNWNGRTTVIVRAIDDEGLETESMPINIDILPVNDEPVKGTKLYPAIINIKEGASVRIDLDADTADANKYFVDYDSDPRFFAVDIDPMEETEGDQLSTAIDNNTWELDVFALGDWFTASGESVRIRVFCDDDPIDINQSEAFQDILFTVSKQEDDPPVWTEIEPQQINEDVSKYLLFNLRTDGYLSDADENYENMILKYVKEEDSKIDIEFDSQFNVYATPDPDYYGKETITLSATDGIFTEEQSFELTVVNINDLPKVELLSPRNGAVIYNGTVELKWNGIDVDPGDLANLTYSIYLDTTGGTTLFKDDHVGTSLVITSLTDKSTYYWQVIPKDGEGEGTCISVPCPAEFYIDIGIKPHTVLKLPADEAVTNNDYIILTWDGFGEEGFTITYDVYMSNSSLEEPYPESNLIESGLTETEVLVEELVSGDTYYWTIIPSTAKGFGTCESGVWTFKYDPTKTPYKLKIEAPARIDLEEGEFYQKAINIKNIGSNPDIIIPSLDAGTLKFAVELESVDKELNIDKDDTLILILNISADVINIGSYEIMISAKSLGNGDVESVTIELNVVEKEEESGTELSAMMISIPLIAIIIVLVLIFMVMRRRKRIDDEKRRVEAELLKPLEGKTLDASGVQYFPGSGAGVGAAPQLPSVSLPQDYAAGAGAAPGAGYPYGPGAGVQALPQLPPAMDPSGAQPQPAGAQAQI
jgi:hypothetical protein